MSYGPPPEPNASVPHPGGGAAADRPKGFGAAVAAVVLGLAGCVLPLLPMDLTGVRAYVGLPSGVGGIILAIVAYRGHSRGKPLAMTGAILSALALVLWMIMTVGQA
ncbi:hypothetical protein [Streptomyces sp. WMMB 322]|uniref:hypothetical protein n=1 Tax=Streptomyces sp. WMMB 322 TaxID=1286821 RepID=UPI0006E31AD3|nr:hypothetical protein [Streptomyces sp. WMMB 322]SCK42427.1 hypothetical protein H180DRAFT_03691 [Streptomyces sp. WMMB 322]